MRAMILLLGVLTLADDAKKDQVAMQGDWSCIKYVRDGMEFDDDTAGSLFRTVNGDEYTVHRFRKLAGKGKFKLDPSKSPRHIDLTPSEGALKGKTLPGIYKFEDGDLSICFGAPGGTRPTAFASKEGSGHTLNVWRREKK